MNARELKDLSVSNRQKLRDAIERGDQKAALAKLDEMVACETRFRQVFLKWIDLMLRDTAAKLGEDYVFDFMKLLFEKNLKPFVGPEAGEPRAEERIKNRAYIWTGMHDSDIKLEEDSEKFTLTAICDSGGWIRSQEDSGKTTRAFPWSNSQPGMAYYCAHCTVSYEMLFLQQYGFPNFIVLPPTKAGEPCVQYMYKDVKAIPRKYLEMFQARTE